MDNKTHVVKCKIYLKNGLVVDIDKKYEKLTEAENVVENSKRDTREVFRNNNEFQFSLGDVVVRGSEIAAIKIYVEE